MKVRIVRYKLGEDQPYEQIELEDFDTLRTESKIFYADHDGIREFVEIEEDDNDIEMD